MTRNEAAERLRGLIWHPYDREKSELLDAALAEERRHVIEQNMQLARDVVEFCNDPKIVAQAQGIFDDLSTSEQKR